MWCQSVAPVVSVIILTVEVSLIDMLLAVSGWVVSFSWVISLVVAVSLVDPYVLKCEYWDVCIVVVAASVLSIVGVSVVTSGDVANVATGVEKYTVAVESIDVDGIVAVAVGIGVCGSDAGNVATDVDVATGVDVATVAVDPVDASEMKDNQR